MNHRKVRAISAYSVFFVLVALMATPFSREGIAFLLIGFSLLFAWWEPGEPFPLTAAIQKWRDRRKVGP